MKGFSAWPAIIRAPHDAKVKKGYQWVFFFGSHNYARVPKNDVVCIEATTSTWSALLSLMFLTKSQKPYMEFRETLNRDTKNASFRAAIDEAEDIIRTRNPE